MSMLVPRTSRNSCDDGRDGGDGRDHPFLSFGFKFLEKVESKFEMDRIDFTDFSLIHASNEVLTSFLLFVTFLYGTPKFNQIMPKAKLDLLLDQLINIVMFILIEYCSVLRRYLFASLHFIESCYQLRSKFGGY